LSKKITMNLSVSSVQNAIKELRQYQQDLNRKCEIFCQRLTELGKVTAEAKVNESPLGKYVVVTTDIKPEKAGCKAILIATGVTKSTDYGDVNMLLLIEFGAGIHYNSVPNPKAGELGFGVGTFPGQTHAFEDGWYYPDENGEWHYTHGTKATMPMYNASTEMLLNIRKIAREVFGS
jgi:hypothetical protein